MSRRFILKNALFILLVITFISYLLFIFDADFYNNINTSTTAGKLSFLGIMILFGLLGIAFQWFMYKQYGGFLPRKDGKPSPYSRFVLFFTIGFVLLFTLIYIVYLFFI
jgi:NhaP-type Na+/H+ or K+/H+ antiporter